MFLDNEFLNIQAIKRMVNKRNNLNNKRKIFNKEQNKLLKEGRIIAKAKYYPF
tara:strand:+ start:146 stop:304 length:159 start_codon:yes stop_codon:yes gene_type:complete